jgi:hypothetical protein
MLLFYSSERKKVKSWESKTWWPMNALILDFTSVGSAWALPGFVLLFRVQLQCELYRIHFRFAKLIKGRHATKVAIINLSGLFEITITVKYLNFYVSEIWCKCTFFIIYQRRYKNFFFKSFIYLQDLLFFLLISYR